MKSPSEDLGPLEPRASNGTPVGSSAPPVGPDPDPVTRLGRDFIQALADRYGEAAVSRQLEALERHGSVIEDPRLWLTVAVQEGFKYRDIEAVATCACGSTRNRPLSRFVYWNLLQYRQCRDCGLLFVSPRLAPEEMGTVFDAEYFDHADLEYWGERRRAVFDDVLRLIRRYDGEKVLDVGAGYGHFVRYLGDRGYEAEGVELSGGAARIGRERLQVRIHQGTVHSDVIESGEYSCTTCLDTLYYSPDPRADLRRMAELLRPGGIVILRLRRIRLAATRSRLMTRRAHGPTVLPAQHVWGFTPRTATALLERLGWTVLHTEAAARSSVERAHAPMARFLAYLVKHTPRLVANSFNLVATPGDHG